MVAYLNKLMDEVAEAHSARAQQKQAAAHAARERLTPLEDRLARVLATIPDELQREGLSLPTLQTTLRGRWRGNCHPGELGRALRKLGFVRVRKWHHGTGFRALWHRERETHHG